VIAKAWQLLIDLNFPVVDPVFGLARLDLADLISAASVHQLPIAMGQFAAYSLAFLEEMLLSLGLLSVDRDLGIVTLVYASVGVLLVL
jgi:hypothetical protein